MNLNELAKHCYDNAVRRGKVTDVTTKRDFMLDLLNEVFEFDKAKQWDTDDCKELIEDLEKSATDAQFDLRFCESIKNHEPNEIADIISILLTYCHKMGYDIDKYLKHTVKYNSIRN